ncbi:hypothetical protein SAMN05216257_101751 [Meinhardsimonia xiamenensis]|jgi:hypothetical protein|uniref:DUF6473 domain-containing protein n=1 Tax=Meinhardsimonia xiamenensis TaxID=990712 RepID=A0A1G8ZHU7_9RHOB|nr:DUF6473 family protein [Meinhardsimonia xiamenensis]PRX37725.1 hypothetical protein LV81_01506 [Meinhardsimonia xiamenensis]SDK14702.1 hypothetical protein SAMN05216257_101751 [Meinhardsimonia xiamenensis]
MHVAGTARLGPDYQPCQYGRSKVSFRGPRVEPEGRYLVYLGGNETFGRFIEEPFPVLVSRAVGLPAINLGCVNAGLDLYVKDSSLLEIIARAETVVIQIMGAQNMSNRFYAVHPRRNDRFLRASMTLKALYPEVDFTEYHFTRHLLMALRAQSPRCFDLVVEELRAAWVARMRGLIEQVTGRAILLWLSDRAPEDDAEELTPGGEPLLVNREMLNALADTGAQLVEHVASPAEIASGREAMVFSEIEQAVAREMLGPRVHADVAARLVPFFAPRDELKRPA